MSSTFEQLLRELAGGLSVLPDKPEETAENTLRALWHVAGGRMLSAELAMETQLGSLDESGIQRLRELIRRRLSGVPLGHLTCRQRFADVELLAGPGALIPRKETELLARAATDIAVSIAARQPTLLMMDVCTGSGNVVLSVAHRVAAVRAFAADLSEDAVILARENAAHLGLEDRVEFRVGDLLRPFDSTDFHGQVDLLTCNPPYISSAKVGQMAPEISAHEPRLAFDGGPFGIAILVRLLEEAPQYIRPEGWLAFEVGLGQGPTIARRMGKAGVYRSIRTIPDSKGDVRAIVAQR